MPEAWQIIVFKPHNPEDINCITDILYLQPDSFISAYHREFKLSSSMQN